MQIAERIHKRTYNRLIFSPETYKINISFIEYTKSLFITKLPSLKMHILKLGIAFSIIQRFCQIFIRSLYIVNTLQKDQCFENLINCGHLCIYFEYTTQIVLDKFMFRCSVLITASLLAQKALYVKCQKQINKQPYLKLFSKSILVNLLSSQKIYLCVFNIHTMSIYYAKREHVYFSITYTQFE